MNSVSSPTSAPDHLLRRIARGTLAGLAAAATGLAVAEVVATTSKTFQSPVLDVADRVVDGVPQSVKRLAIRWFGTNDKIALLVGIASILAVYAAIVGIVTLGRHRKRLIAGLVGIGLFGAAGAYASQSTRRAAPLVAVLPSLVGAVAAGAVLVLLRRTLLGHRDVKASDSAPASGELDGGGAETRPSIAQLTPSDRRRFLAAAGLTTLGAVVVGTTARRLGTNETAAASRRKVSLPRARKSLPAAPVGIQSEAPGVTPFFTPNNDFYRIDTAITVPQVPIEGWTLKVRGMVDSPLELTFNELVSRELIESDITLTCVSNEVGGKLMGTARWLGIRLDDLLRDAGIQSDADQIVGRSVDGYTCGFPVAALDGRDALIAIGMNGEPLPLQHGFPARLIVPGLYGYVSATKWLTELEVTRFDRFDQYWVERGWVSDAPIKVQSRIDTPKGLSKVAAGTVAIGGIAWAQTRGIERVEVRIDDGEWVETVLADELNDVTWRQWSYAWSAEPGRHTITVRATEKNGPIQTDERSEPFPSGATGQHNIIVIVS
jgi:DMSO/TMAO reductase YedYZ molybdopterin-dependent catalytic subunit